MTSLYTKSLLIAAFLLLTVAQAPAANNNTAAPILYYHPQCGHCQKVEAYLRQTNQTVAMRNTAEPKYQQELQHMGQNGVPVLVVNGKVIVGSGPIIAYLSQNPNALR